MYRSYPVKTFYPGSALILETNGPSNSSIYIFWLMAPFDFRRTIFFYSSSTPRTKGKIKSQKSHIENQFIEIIKKMTRFRRQNIGKSEGLHQRKSYRLSKTSIIIETSDLLEDTNFVNFDKKFLE